MAKNEMDFNERLQTAAKARQAMLAKAAAISPKNSPDYAQRQAERLAVSVAREKRKAEAAARKLAEAARIAEEKAAAERAAQLAAEAERLAKEEELNRAANEARELKARQKANRDAKYAARQARRESRSAAQKAARG
ncbi:MAG: hypothetical protein EPO08_03255 [Rhodospirillaceae bacterium]|nr:MAG: hypothetical protein EPO08_03255 [Rhodospirillaceae bacterium]